ncbi:carbohydrate-binding family 9-like protein [Paenibacillus dendritiformis]
MAMTSEANTEEVFSKVTDSPVPRYICRRVPDGEPNWKEAEAAVLADVVTGEAPRYRTQVQACWSERTLYLRFECEDERVVSPYTKRDDPLFEADVVECFIQPGEDGAA